MPGTLSPTILSLVRAILSKVCADMLLCGAGGSLPLRRPASAVRMAGKRGSSFNLARLVDDGPYPAEGSEHNADLVRTLPPDLFRVAGSHHVGTAIICHRRSHHGYHLSLQDQGCWIAPSLPPLLSQS